MFITFDNVISAKIDRDDFIADSLEMQLIRQLNMCARVLEHKLQNV